MATLMSVSSNDRQFTNLTTEPTPSPHQPTSVNSGNNRRAETYSESRNAGSNSGFQSKGILIFMLVVSLGLLAACIALAIALAVLVRPAESATSASISNGTDSQSSSTTPLTNTPSTTSAANTSNTATCGIQDITPSPTLARIAGGTTAVPHSWPWIVYYEEQVECKEGNCPVYSCNGVLVHPRYILIAAQCVRAAFSYKTVIAGLHNAASVLEDAIIQIQKVQEIFQYSSYNNVTQTDDLALLQLITPFGLTKYVDIVCLSNAQPQVGDTAIIAGWGSTMYGGNGSTVLNQAFTQVVGNCSAWRSSKNISAAGQICAANTAVGSSICTDDTGGPLLTKKANQWIVSGVASIVDPSGCNTTTNKPNIYTNVAYYFSWINSVINSGSI